MKLRIVLSISLLAFAGAQHANAQEGKSRAEVRAELDRAIQAGELLVPGELGLTLRQLRPDLYPSAAVQGKSRNEVKKELADAIHNGEIVAGESSGNLNELYPSQYPPVARLPGKSREEAKAELAEALRTGDILAGGELGLTRYQLSPGRYRDAARMMATPRPAPTARRGTFSWSF